MKFNERIKALREDKDLRQVDIAKALKTTQRRVSHLETGDSEPTLLDIEQYCRFFDKSADYMLGYTNDPKPFPEKK